MPMRAEAPARRTASHLQQLSDARADGRVPSSSPHLSPDVQAHVATIPRAKCCGLRASLPRDQQLTAHRLRLLRPLPYLFGPTASCQPGNSGA